MNEDNERRTELAAFLKSRRDRLSPADVGLTAGKGRRSTGLRREEVATLSGVGLTWYTALEQGKAIQVSAGFLENLARGLRLSELERTHLFALAQRRLPALASPSEGQASYHGLQAILDGIACPAYARNSHFDVIAWNAANTEMFGDFAVIPKTERNIVRLMFLRRYHRETMPRWEEDARAVLSGFRVNLGRAVDPSPFRMLIAELLSKSADFMRLWAEHDVSDVGEGVTQFRSPRHGVKMFRHHLLMPESRPDLRIAMYIETPHAASP